MTKFIYQFAQFLRRFGVNFHEEHNAQVQAMKETIQKLNGIQFKIEIFGDGSWTAESANIEGIVTGGTNKDSMNDAMKDALFTYFEIPPQFCNDKLIKYSNEPVTLEQRVYA